jgi:hypothetical protein
VNRLVGRYVADLRSPALRAYRHGTMTMTPARGASEHRLRAAASWLVFGLGTTAWTSLAACVAWLIVLATFSPWPEEPGELQWAPWVEWGLLGAIWLLLLGWSFDGHTKARAVLLGGLPPRLWSDKLLWRQVHAVYEREPSDDPLPRALLDQLSDPRFQQERPAAPVGDVWRHAVVFRLNPALLPRGARQHLPARRLRA